MWLRSLFASLKSRRATAAARRPRLRLGSIGPQVEMLEGRVLLSTYLVDRLTGTAPAHGLHAGK
jgi:hypothetical protein